MKKENIIILVIFIIIIFLGLVLSGIIKSPNNKIGDCKITSIVVSDKYIMGGTDLEIPIKIKISNFGDGDCEIQDIGTTDLWKRPNSGGEYPILTFYNNPDKIIPSSTKEYNLVGYLNSVDIDNARQNSGGPKAININVNSNKNSNNFLHDGYVIRVFK